MTEGLLAIAGGLIGALALIGLLEDAYHRLEDRKRERRIARRARAEEERCNDSE